MLVLAGGGTGSIDWLGVAMALACAGFYTVFILGSERASAKTPAVPFAASVATGAAVTFAIAALFTGGVHASGEGVMWAAVIAAVLDRDPDRAVHRRASRASAPPPPRSPRRSSPR